MDHLKINNEEFAQKQLSSTGELPVNSLTRLHDLIRLDSQTQGSHLRYTLSGHMAHQQLPRLHLSIQANLPMICQRCLEEMDVALALNFDYLIAHEQPDEIDDNDEVDWLTPETHMDVQALIEDELLIAIPFAPVHASACKPLVLESGERINPFAVLKGKIK